MKLVHRLLLVVDILLLILLALIYFCVSVIKYAIIFISVVSWFVLLPLWILLRLIKLLNIPSVFWISRLVPMNKLIGLIYKASDNIADLIEIHKCFL
jgi:hypothetical protein